MSPPMDVELILSDRCAGTKTFPLFDINSEYGARLDAVSLVHPPRRRITVIEKSLYAAGNFAL